MGAFDKTIALIGEAAFEKLRASRFLIVGLGGVGGIALEVAVRSGVGEFTVVDGDKFESTNLNRQILCTSDVIGEYKACVARARALSIDPDVRVEAVTEFIDESNVDEIISRGYSYCIDAIDDIKNKVLLVKACKAAGIPVVSAMGAGNRTDCGFAVTDVFETSNDPFAKKFRHELRQAGVLSLDAVCATSPPSVKSRSPFSLAAPPTVMGAMLANFAVQCILADSGDNRI